MLILAAALQVRQAQCGMVEAPQAQVQDLTLEALLQAPEQVQMAHLWMATGQEPPVVVDLTAVLARHERLVQ